MKKEYIILLVFIGIIILGVFVYTKFFKKGKGLSYNNRIDCSNRFLFVGDSLTAFDQSYADQLIQVCPRIVFKKLAKVGEKTDWMLGQLNSELKNNKYDVITIWGGVNDIYATKRIDQAKSNLQRMYDIAKDSGAKVVAMTVIPTQTYNISTDKDVQLTNDLNKWIRSNGAPDAVIDANHILNDGNDGTKQQFLQSDTLHINVLGQNEIMQDFTDKVIV